MLPKASRHRSGLSSALLKLRSRGAVPYLIAAAIFAAMVLLSQVFDGLQKLRISHRVSEPWQLLSPHDNVSKCSRVFGNGFYKRFDICTGRGATTSVGSGEPIDAGGSPACFYNEFGKTTFCSISDLSIDSRKIRVSRGGEAIEEVLGRDEDEEMPQYDAGALSVACPGHTDSASGLTRGLGELLDDYCVMLPRNPSRKTFHVGTMLDALSTSQSSPGSQSTACDTTVEEPTLFVTRWEYANLYHTMTDWFNVHQLLSTVGLADGTYSIVLLDGHPQGKLDNAWSRLFGQIRRFSEISDGAANICFKRAYFVAAGFISPLSYGISEKLKCERENEYFTSFSKRILDAYDLLHLRDCPTRSPLGTALAQGECLYPDATLSASANGGDLSFVRIVLVFRMNYLIHPRQGDRKVSRTIQNELELTQAAQSLSRVSVHTAHFETMTMGEQLAAVARADIFVGVHGAALTHTLFQPPGSALVEILAPESMGNNHFRHFSQLTQNLYYTHDPKSDVSTDMYIDPEPFRRKLQEAVDHLRSTREGLH